ncbi:MAG TPA: hypothetical protein VGD39_21220 [Nocardioides sp.]
MGDPAVLGGLLGSPVRLLHVGGRRRHAGPEPGEALAELAGALVDLACSRRDLVVAAPGHAPR